jgi:5'(3')-deoxyribonucleotidase
MKKIAIDLDGVVFDSENLYRVYSEIYDVDYFKCDNLVDNAKRTFQQRYRWSKDEASEFYKENSKQVLMTANVMTGAEIVLKKLSSFFELIVVTARTDEETNFAKDRLLHTDLELIYFNNEKHKIDRLINEKINYIIDDDENICINAAKAGIKAIYFKNAAAPLVEENEFLKVVNNWGEIYKYLMLNK